MPVLTGFAGRPIFKRVKAPIAVRLTSARNSGLNRGNKPLFLAVSGGFESNSDGFPQTAG